VSFRTRPQVKSHIHIYVYTFTYIHMYTDTHAENRFIGDRVLTVILVWY
jgi:hypothetical protein